MVTGAYVCQGNVLVTIGEITVPASGNQVDQLTGWAEGFAKREWGVESANGPEEPSSGSELADERAKIDIEWLDQSTLQVVVEIPGDQVEVAEVRTELAVYITDEAGNFEYERFDVAIWKADP